MPETGNVWSFQELNMGNGRITFESRALVGALLLFVLVSSVAGQTNEVVPEPSALRETERQTPDGNSENWSLARSKYRYCPRLPRLLCQVFRPEQPAQRRRD